MKLDSRLLCRLGWHWQQRSRLDLLSGQVQRHCANCGAVIDHGQPTIAPSEIGHGLRRRTKRFRLAPALIGLTALLILIVAPHIDFKGQPAEAALSTRLPEARPQALGHPGWTDQVAAEMLKTEQPEETNQYSP